jgi:hypothetical protein
MIILQVNFKLKYSKSSNPLKYLLGIDPDHPLDEATAWMND